jgi:SulP family sulfate permease
MRPETGAPPRTFRFKPALITSLKHGYSVSDLRDDAFAGLTVAVVALPLSMALAVASGASPERGLYTAIFGGFFVSLLGGSRFQIGGPAGAFIVLVSATLERHGLDGLILATMLAGMMLILLGVSRLGSLIRYIPHPVTIGFTAGIAMIILASQLRELLGLDIPNEPAALLEKLRAIGGAIGTLKPQAVAISLLGILIIILVRRYRPAWPGFLIAVAVCSIAVIALQLPVSTIGSRFGEMPSGIPAPALPDFSLEKIRAVLPDAIAIALLGAIESLLSAVVADRMSGQTHRSDGELVAQGAANIVSSAFGGIPVTGTIARTATNIRAGAKSPVSGILHCVYLLLFMLAAAPLVAYIPLAALGAVLAVVAWNMAERYEAMAVLRKSWSAGIVLMTTLLLTAFYDLVAAIVAGVVLSLLFGYFAGRKTAR